MKLIVGLGNPGVEYSQTRHNFGFMAVDNYIRRSGGVWHFQARFNAQIAELSLDTEKVLFVKPQTFYNLVGESVQRIRSFYKIDLDDVLVIHDEMALPLGAIRTRRGGSDAGNNGIKNIINTAIKAEPKALNSPEKFLQAKKTTPKEKISNEKNK